MPYCPSLYTFIYTMHSRLSESKSVSNTLLHSPHVKLSQLVASLPTSCRQVVFILLFQIGQQVCNKQLTICSNLLIFVCFYVFSKYNVLHQYLSKYCTYTLFSISICFLGVTSNVSLSVWNVRLVRCKVPKFVLKFVPTMYDNQALQVVISYFNKSANQIAHN